MEKAMFDHPQFLSFRDATAGVVWRMVVCDSNGAIFQDTAYKALIRLSNSELRELLVARRFIGLAPQLGMESRTPVRKPAA